MGMFYTNTTSLQAKVGRHRNNYPLGVSRKWHISLLVSHKVLSFFCRKFNCLLVVTRLGHVLSCAAIRNAVPWCVSPACSPSLVHAAHNINEFPLLFVYAGKTTIPFSIALGRKVIVVLMHFSATYARAGCESVNRR